jgi:hypothetical protein
VREAFAARPDCEQDVLIAPFVEEVFDHRPSDAPLDLKAKVTVVVRNSLLEQAHHDGPLGSGIIAITELAATPLSHLLAARRRRPVPLEGTDPFAGLPSRYPRAWSCLRALTDVFADGGRAAWKPPAASVPDLPTDEEVTSTTISTDGSMTVLSAIDRRFDERLLALLRQAATDDGMVLYTSALSRYSRNSAKLHRILEFLLAHGATILTTNYLFRPTDVWIRRGPLVKPTSRDPLAGITRMRGLAGTHRKLAEGLTEQYRRP